MGCFYNKKYWEASIEIFCLEMNADNDKLSAAPLEETESYYQLPPQDLGATDYVWLVENHIRGSDNQLLSEKYILEK